MGNLLAPNTVQIEKKGEYLKKTSHYPRRLWDKSIRQHILYNEIYNIILDDEKIKLLEEKKELDIPYCIFHNDVNNIDQCAGLFIPETITRSYKDSGDKILPQITTLLKSEEYRNEKEYVSELDEYRVVKGPTPCKGLLYRPGGYFNENDFKYAVALFGKNNIIDGNFCRIIYQDYNYDDEDLYRCCFGRHIEIDNISKEKEEDRHKRCNKFLINDYKTNHCNIIMNTQCNQTPDHPRCMKWLEGSNSQNRNNQALALYSKLCQKDHTKLYCDYLCSISRVERGAEASFCDHALTTWCTNNPHISCTCIYPSEEQIPDIEEYLGPKECWLSNCASQADEKWLTTDQLDTRRKCNLTSCIITIDSLTLDETAKIRLINDCVSGASVSSAQYHNLNNNDKYIKKYYTPGILFSPESGIMLGSLIILLLLSQ